MFQKNTFASTSSGFGTFNAGATTSSPFGGFKPTAGTSAFGAAPTFGASPAAQPAPTGGLFGSGGATGGLFGTAPTSAAPPAFGAATSGGFGFGQTAPSAGLFGSPSTTGGLFGTPQQQNTSTFGAKPAAFGFGSPASTASTGLFGAAPATGGLFGQQNTSMGGGGLFGGTAGGFGAPQQSGTAHVKYSPLVGTDVMLKSGTSHNINIRHHCITCMKEYENKSLEELRLEDYTAGRKGSTSAGMFGGFQAQPEAKPLFGGTSFGSPATTSASNMFGGGGLTGGFGAQNNSFSFGGATQNTTSTPLFGAPKPTFGATPAPGTGLFGAPTTQAPAFGTTTPSFGGFGTPAQPQTSSLFGAKPATTGFGATAAPTTGFGAFGAGTSGGGLFGNKLASSTAPAFGTTTPGFGTLSGGFGTNTTGSGLFGGANALGAKPAAPTFGFAQPSTGLGLGGGLGGGTFQNKPAGASFLPFNSAEQPSMFNTGQNTQTLGFGNTSLGGGLGGGLGGFGTGSTLGGSSLGGLGAFNTAGSALAPMGLSGATNSNVHEQILTLASRPYGDSPLYKDLLPDSSATAEDALRPTNPAAMKAVLDSSGYRVSPPSAPRLTLQPLAPAPARNKKSLFEGLEESDPSLEDKLSLRPSRKRLVLRPQQTRAEPAPRLSSESVVQSESLSKEIALNVMSPTSDTSFQEKIRGVNTDLEDANGSWLGSKLTWNGSKENVHEGQSSPRIYPDLAKEMPEQSERRASWLTTKPLRKPPAALADSAESSVRELRVERTERNERTERIERTEREERSMRVERVEQYEDKENIDNVSVSEEEAGVATDAPPHPTGVRLTRPGYYTIPTLDDMIGYMGVGGTCVVPHLTIGRRNYGNVYFDCEIDVAGLNLDQLGELLLS